MKKALIFAIVILANTTFLFAQKGSIKGYVETAQGESLAAATVRIEATALGAKTDSNGEFEIKSLRPGNYRLLVSMVGYKLQTTTVAIQAGKTAEVRIIMREQAIETEEIIVSANKRVQAAQDVPISVAILDKRSIERRDIVRLDEALEYIPGINVNRDNASIRGSSGFSYGFGSRIALLLDGFPLLSGDQGDMKFDAIPMFNIERIEVVKGAGSALYGTSAIGGVINLITKKPTEAASGKVRLVGGVYSKPRYEQWEYSDALHSKYGVEASYSKKFGAIGALFSASAVEDQSYRRYDDNFRYNILTKLDYELDEKTNFALTANFGRKESDNWVYWKSLERATFPPDDADLSEVILSDKLAVFANASRIFDEKNFINVRTGAFYTLVKNNFDPSYIYYRKTQAISYNTEVQLNSRFNENFFLTTGLNHVFNTIEANIYGNNDQNIASAYAQAELGYLANLTITAGTRLDYEETADAESHFEVSPKIGISYIAPFGASLRASAGRGFRAATVAERFANVPFAGFEVLPNPSLDPEKSLSYELGAGFEFEFLGTPFIADLALFQNDMNDLIEPTFIESGGKIKFLNITEARIRGLELNIKTLLFGFAAFQTSLTAMDPVDLTLNKTLKYRSKFLWYSSLTIPAGLLEFQADYRFKSKTVNIDDRLSIGIPDADARVPAHILDARISLKMDNFAGFPLTATLNAKNLLDYYYTEIVGSLGMTRYISLQISSGF